MIKATFGLTREPFYRSDVALLPQQAEAMEMIKIHAQHGGFLVIVGNPGVGKSVMREHLEHWGKERDNVIVSFRGRNIIPRESEPTSSWSFITREFAKSS